MEPAAPFRREAVSRRLASVIAMKCGARFMQPAPAAPDPSRRHEPVETHAFLDPDKETPENPS